MSDKEILDELDARAARAAADLNDRARSRAVPAFDPEAVTTIPGPDARPDTARSRLPLYGVAAAVLALVAATVWFGTRTDDPSDLADELAVGSVRPHALGDDALEPLGFRPYQFSTDDGTGSTGDIGMLHVFGPADDDPRVGILVMLDGGHGEEDGTPVTIGDRTGHLIADGPMGTLLVVGATNDTDSPTILVMGTDLEDETLIAVARATTVEGTTPTVDQGGLPDGWRLLTDRTSPWVLSPVATARGAVAGDESHHAIYGPGTASGDMVSLVTRAGNTADLHSPRLLMTETDDITVRGQPGWAGRMDSGDPHSPSIWTVSWMERPGETLTLTGLGVDRNQLLALAESVEAVTADRWAELVLDSQLGQYDVYGVYGEGEVLEMARGALPDGTPWVLRLVPDSGAEDGFGQDRVILRVALNRGGNSWSSSAGVVESGPGSEPEAPVFSYINMDDYTDRGRTRIVAHGLVRDDVHRIELLDASDQVLGHADMVIAHDRTAWLAELPETATVAVAVDADGRELGRDQLDRADHGGGWSEEAVMDDGTVVTTLSGEDQPTPAPVMPGDDQPAPTPILPDD